MAQPQPPQGTPEWWTAVRAGDAVGVAGQLRENVSLRDEMDPRTALKSQRWAIHEASGLGHHGVVSELLDHGADPLQPDRFGRTPLMLAAALGHEEVMRILLAAAERTAGVDIGRAVSGQDVEKQSALHHAAISGNRECIGMLLRYGASEEMEGKQGFTPAEFAGKCGRADPLTQETTLVASERAQRHQWNRTLLAFIRGAGKFLPEDVLRQVWLAVPKTLPDAWTSGDRRKAPSISSVFSQITGLSRPGVNRHNPRSAAEGEGCCVQ